MPSNEFINLQNIYGVDPRNSEKFLYKCYKVVKENCKKLSAINLVML